MRIVILGAGIGGSTAYHALQRLGFSPVIYESAKQLLPIGAGITLAPNGLHVLKQLGLLDVVKRIGVSNKMVTGYDGAGVKIGGTDFSQVEHEFGYPLLGMSRHELQQTLLQSIESRSINYGKRAHSVTSKGGEAVVHFEDGDAVAADLVIGGDGARSTASEHVTGFKGEALLRPTGFICTYGLTAPGSFPEAESGNVTWVYPAAGSALSSRCWGTWCTPGGRYFWFTVHRHGDLPSEVGQLPYVGLWASGEDHLAELKRAFGGLFHPCDGGFDRILSSTERSSRFSLADKKGEHPFVKGNVALLGDSARTVTPWGGQGANMAIEDAAELANALAPMSGRGFDGSQIAAALKKYEMARASRSRLVTQFSRQTGAVQMMGGLTGRLMRKAALSMPMWATHASVKWLYGHQIHLLDPLE